MSDSPFIERLVVQADASGVALTREHAQLLDAYFQLLVRWNRKINLTSLKLDPDNDDMINRMFLEPLAAAAFVPSTPIRWIDVGSGGGSPAIPLKVVRPNAALTMVESRTRKAAFLREVIRVLELPFTVVVDDRLEVHAERRPSTADFLTMRAVRLDAKMASACRELLREGGKLLVFERGFHERQPLGPFGLPSESIPLVKDSDATLHIFVAA